GRYLQCDPLGIAGGYNLYAYVTNPLTGVDILGLTGPYGTDPKTGNTDHRVGRPTHQIQRPTKPVSLPSTKKVKIDMDEVISGHTRTGDRYVQGVKAGKEVPKDLFPDDMNEKQIRSAILDAYAHSKIITSQGARGERVMVRGITKDGMIIEMWVNKETKMIETAYPKGWEK
ncbi:MAG: EndoU domain-containing protein, partial [Blastocatellia bacterium]|nr:EndoU domain-containing protein [Blastocatellia bacterium]